MAQQRLVAARDQHDDGRVGAGEMVGAAAGAGHDVAGAVRLARGAADAAEPVAAAPVHQPARMGQDRRLVRRQPGADRAQFGEFARARRQQRHRVLRRAQVEAKVATPSALPRKRPAMLAVAMPPVGNTAAGVPSAAVGTGCGRARSGTKRVAGRPARRPPRPRRSAGGRRGPAGCRCRDWAAGRDDAHGGGPWHAGPHRRQRSAAAPCPTPLLSVV